MKTVDDLRWVKYPILDDGFVCLVDMMGNEMSVLQAARVSYGRDVRDVHGSMSPKDIETLRYFMRHHHTTPLEMVEFKFLVRVPMDCWRQWIRHRTASVNEYSTRYTPAIDSCQTTEPNEWRRQSTANKQGSGEALSYDLGSTLSKQEQALHDQARAVYDQRLSAGVAREQARKDLPLSNYTEAYWKIDLHNLLHFLSLRMDAHAQYEIRQYADAIGSIVADLLPNVWEAFNCYNMRRDAMLLTALDVKAIGQLKDWESLFANDREREECRAKLIKLNLIK